METTAKKDNKRPGFAARLFGHFRTVTRHRSAVFVNCCRAGLIRQGLTHDLSKFSPSEFFPGVRYYQGYRSPNEAEREVNGMSLAWMHHKGRNRHHFDYWIDYDPKVRGQVKAVKMPFRFVAEMFCDRVAASRIYKGKAFTDASPLEYFLPGKEKRMIHPETSDELEGLLRLMAEQGQKAAFAYIKKRMKKQKKADRLKK